MSIKPLFAKPEVKPQQTNKNLYTPVPDKNDPVNRGSDFNSSKVSSDPVESNAIRAPSVHEARKLLNDQIIAALEKTLTQSNQTSLYELDPADFAPEKVAERILSFVGAAFASLDSGDKNGQMDKLEQARKGIEKGFNDAKDILEGLGVFKDEIADNANKTYDLLQQGLDKIASNIASGASVLEGLFSTSQASSVEKSSLFKQSFDFELTTQDGDKVTINVNRLDAFNETSHTKESAEESSVNYSSTRLSQSGYSISIEGQLDENEINSIDKLLSQMTDVANKYFSGDTQAALDQVSSLGYNMSEIASFSLNLTEVQQTKATETYQQIGGLANDNPSSTRFGQMIKPLQDYAAQLIAAHNQFIGNKLFENNSEQFKQLLDQVSSINNLFSDANSKNQFDALNSALLETDSQANLG